MVCLAQPSHPRPLFFSQGQTIGESLVEHSSSAGTRYMNQKDNEQITVEDLFALSVDTENYPRGVGLGQREIFCTATKTET